MKLVVPILAWTWTILSVARGNETPTVVGPMRSAHEANKANPSDSTATVKDYPYIASLQHEGLANAFCSGILIAPQYILTAGNCIPTETTVIVAHIGTGVGTLSKGEEINVIQGSRHPMYNDKEQLYNVGLLKLERPSVHKTATVCAANGADNPVGTEATVLGWGLTADGSLGHTLQEVHVALISDEECNKMYNTTSITDGMMCAGNDGGKNLCGDDTAGPLVTSNDILIGFASGRGTCGVNAGLYTRLTFVMDYINAILSGSMSSNFKDNTASQLSTPELGDTPTVAQSISDPTPPVGSIAGVSSTQASSVRSPPSDCTFHRRLSEITEGAIEEDLNEANEAKKIVHTIAVEADKELKEMADASDDELADIKRTKATAEQEEKEIDEQIKKDKKEEEAMYDEEVKEMGDAEDGEEEEEEEEEQKEEEEDEALAKTLRKPLKKTKPDESDGDENADTSVETSKKTSTEAQDESEEQEEITPLPIKTTKATKKPATKSNDEESEEEDKELEKEIEELKEKEKGLEEEKILDTLEKKFEEDGDEDEDEDDHS